MMNQSTLPVMAEVVSIEPLTKDILRVLLKPSHYIPYEAGQYLQVFVQEEAVSYSIANAALGSHQYELHVRHRPYHALSQALLDDMRTQGEVPIFLPLGACHTGRLSRKKPTLLIAQGTGFAPMKAMIEHWLSAGEMPPILFCWVARAETDYYLDELVHHWETHVETFRYVPYLAEMMPKDLIKQLLLLTDFPLQEMQVVLAGPFDRVLLLKEALMTAGLNETQLFSDAFEERTGRK